MREEIAMGGNHTFKITVNEHTADAYMSLRRQTHHFYRLNPVSKQRNFRELLEDHCKMVNRSFGKAQPRFDLNHIDFEFIRTYWAWNIRFNQDEEALKKAGFCVIRFS